MQLGCWPPGALFFLSSGLMGGGVSASLDAGRASLIQKPQIRNRKPFEHRHFTRNGERHTCPHVMDCSQNSSALGWARIPQRVPPRLSRPCRQHWRLGALPPTWELLAQPRLLWALTEQHRRWAMGLLLSLLSTK